MNDKVQVHPLTIVLGHPDDKVSLLQRLVIGSGLIFDLHKSGHKCTNIYKKFSCDICECKDKPLCKAIKLFIKLEREYYLLQIYNIIFRYSRMERVEKKQPQIQGNLF